MHDLYTESERIKQIADNAFRGRAIKLWFDKACSIVTDECKIWPFAKINGYGMMNINRKTVYVHKLAAINKYGPIPVNQEVAHGPCHNRACFNNEHLTYKTKKENQFDRFRDGTDSSKLTPLQIEEIKQLLKSGTLLHKQIAEIFKVNRSRISQIQGNINGKNYR